MAGKDGYKKIKILIASPSDVGEERKIAEKVINEWNARNSDERKLMLEAVLWESHSAPETGDRTQGILNKQIVDGCDAAIGIFWTRIGTHTGIAPGGAVEEIERLEKKGKKVMLYFSGMSVPRYGIDYSQLQKVDEFKTARQKKGDLTWEYNDRDEFGRLLKEHLDMQVRRWFLDERGTENTDQTTPDHFQLQQCYQQTLKEELGKIKLLGAPDIDSIQVNLDDSTFVPLRISHSWKTEDRFKGKHRQEFPQENTEHHLPDELMQLVFPEYRMLLVIGDPGSGKTTLMKYYALCCLQNKQERLYADSAPVKVFYLPLRDLKTDEKGQYATLSTQLSYWAHQRSYSIEKDVFEGWLRNPDTKSLVLLDGLDEISDLEKRKEICRWIDRSWSGFSEAYFVVTSRFTGYRKTEGVELTADHIRADVMDFTPEQQEEFLSKWFYAAHQRELCPPGMHVDQWIDRQKKHAEERTTKIVEYLEKPENKGLRELAAVPMMLQIMAILWKERDFLPGNRVKLYSAALDYLLEFRDERRMIPPLLPAEKARRVLAPVSLWMQEELEADEAEKSVMQGKMQEKLDTFDHPPNAEAFCRNLVDRAGLLAEYGDREYVFRHKTFKEYLAGVQLKEDRHKYNRVNRLVAHFGEDWWNETLRFFIAQVDEDIFDLFMQQLFESDVSEELSQKQQELLRSLIEEATEKKTEALCEKLLDTETSVNRQRYILDCLKQIDKSSALDSVRQFISKGMPKNRDVEGRAHEVLNHIQGYHPISGVASVIASAKGELKPVSDTRTVHLEAIGIEAGRPGTGSPTLTVNPSLTFRNPCEHDAQYILIPGGEFIYSQPKPKGTNVTVPDLCVAKYPVTNRQYRSFIDFLAGKPPANDANLALKSYQEALQDLARSNDDAVKGFRVYLKDERNLADRFRSGYDDDRKFNKDDQPVVGVSWYAARAYCLWLTMLAGGEAEYRLPTEVEWEWAAGGRRDKPEEVLEVRKYPWGDSPEPTAKYANYAQNEGATTPVGRYPEGATPDGLYDMAGNVWEWMENWYDDNTKGSKSLRGGSWYGSPGSLVCSRRYGDGSPSSEDYDSGFRVVRPSPLA